MILSQTVEYALRAAVWLAGHDGPQTTQQIADATQVPSSYLSKVLQALRRADLVVGQRGLRGGFVLSKDAESISVLDVVEAVEPIGRIRTCPLGIEEHGVRLCPLHRKLDQALAQIESAFADTSLAELTSKRHELRPLCHPA